MGRFSNKEAGIISNVDLKTFKGQLVHWIFVAVLIVFCVVSVIPTLWVVMTAFKDSKEIYVSRSFFPVNCSPSTAWSRISDAWVKLQLGDSIINTFVKSLGDWFFTIVFCGFAGYSLSKLKPKGTKLVFTLIVWTMLMPGQIRMVPNYITMLHFPFAFDIGGVNLLNTYWSLWIPNAANAFKIILFKNNFDALSNSFVEAAKIDGCSDFGVFFKIMLPLSMPILLFVSITTLEVAWADYFGPLIYLTDNITLPLKIYQMKTDVTIQMNTYFMGLMFACIPPAIIFLVMQKHIMGGITVGGVKG